LAKHGDSPGLHRSAHHLAWCRRDDGAGQGDLAQGQGDVPVPAGRSMTR